MITEILFATGNAGKVATLESHIKLHGLSVKVKQCPLELIEPQASTAVEVARLKARQAYDQVKAPVLVDDSSFHITALGGFPGPYVKYMNETVGIEGIVRFMQNQPDRSAYFMSALVFIDQSGAEHEFTIKESTGTIADTVREKISDHMWSDLWRIFIPAGSDKTLSEMSPEDHETRRLREKGNSSYDLLCDWLSQNPVQPL